MYRHRNELSSAFYTLFIHLGIVDILVIAVRNVARVTAGQALTSDDSFMNLKVLNPNVWYFYTTFYSFLAFS